jgi:protoporphyrinogen oxidase
MTDSNESIYENLGACYVIMGAGPSGLAAAWKLVMEQDSIPVILVEKSERVGGLSASFDWQESRVDYGPHRLSPAIPEVVNFVKDLLGPELLEIKAKHMVLLEGALFQFPPRIRDVLDYRLIRLGFRSALSYLSMRVMRFRRRFDSKDFQQALYSKFGVYFSSRVIEPMVKKVWPGKTESLDPHFVDLRFKVISLLELMRSIFKLRENLNPKIAYYPNNGYGQICEEMVRVLSSRKNFHLFLNSEVEKIVVDELTDRVIEVHVNSKGPNHPDQIRIKSKKLELISSIPIISTMKLFEDAALKKSSTSTPVKFEVVSLRLYMFLFDQNQTLKARTYIFPQSDIQVNRIYEQNLYSRSTVPDGKSLVVADLSYSREGGAIDRLQAMTVPEPSAIYQQLVDLKIFPEIGLIESSYIDVPFAYLRPSLSNAIEVFRMKKAIYKHKNVYLLGRFGAGVYNNADFAILSGFDVARRLLSGKKEELNDGESWNNHHNVFG